MVPVAPQRSSQAARNESGRLEGGRPTQAREGGKEKEK